MFFYAREFRYFVHPLGVILLNVNANNHSTMRNNRFIQAAPEGFLNKEQIKSVYGGRRGFMAGAFASALAVSTAARAQTAPSRFGTRCCNTGLWSP